MPPQTKKPAAKGTKPSATKKKGAVEEESKDVSHAFEADDD